MLKVNRLVKSKVYRQWVDDCPNIHFALLHTAYQRTPSVTHKNKADCYYLEGTTNENGHFAKISCEMPMNQTWCCIEKWSLYTETTDTSLVSHTYCSSLLYSSKLMKAIERAQRMTIRKTWRTKSSSDEQSREQWLVDLSNWWRLLRHPTVIYEKYGNLLEEIINLRNHCHQQNA